jgi:hypothetical protein
MSKRFLIEVGLKFTEKPFMRLHMRRTIIKEQQISNALRFQGSKGLNNFKKKSKIN